MNAICPVTMIPVRAESNERSEMVTQLLFGETFTVLDEKSNWLLISVHLDEYEGWIEKKQALMVSDDFVLKMNSRAAHLLTAKTAVCIRQSDHSPFLILKGSNLPLLKRDIFYLGGEGFVIKDKSRIVPKRFIASRIAHTALDYLNAPYLWGGRSITGIDCSGFVQVVFQACGLQLPRDAAKQIKKGLIIDFLDEVQPGDLAFFDNLQGEIIHVGIILGPGKIIHSSGQVRIDSIDHNGIFRADIQKYTHSLRIIKRLC